MKKILVGLIIVSSVAMAQGRGMNNTGRSNNQKFMNQVELSEEEQVKLNELRAAQRLSAQKNSIELREIKLAIDKELLKEDTDWSVIEGLKAKEYAKRAEMDIARMKHRAELQEEFSLETNNKGARQSKNNENMSNRGNNQGRRGR